MSLRPVRQAHIIVLVCPPWILIFITGSICLRSPLPISLPWTPPSRFLTRSCVARCRSLGTQNPLPVSLTNRNQMPVLGFPSIPFRANTPLLTTICLRNRCRMSSKDYSTRQSRFFQNSWTDYNMQSARVPKLKLLGQVRSNGKTAEVSEGQPCFIYFIAVDNRNQS